MIIKDGTEKNETASTVFVNMVNIISFSKSLRKAQVFEPGQSPTEKEMKRREELRATRDEKFKARMDAIEADYAREEAELKEL